jgi:histidinol dehydrogenase
VPPLDALEPFLPRIAGADPETRRTVTEILEDVLTRGDQAIREYTLRFDGIDLAPEAWELDSASWQSALGRISPTLRQALARSVHRVSEYHQRQRETGFHLAEDDGSVIGMKVAPLDRVGLYVPGGKASYPSTVVMNAVPALVAGVQEIIAVVPPQGVTDLVLAACALSGVTRVFRVGGAQAIGALAYGTRTIPRVDKIVGPGSRWVAEAKRQVVGRVGIDMIAGPTEVLIIADSSARPERVAADMIAQAEHDEDAISWCVSTDPDLAEALPSELERALSRAPREAIARAALERNGLIVTAGSMRDAIEVANRRAPEHLQIVAEGAERIASAVRNAGAIFLGDDTPEPVGDYIAGPSHVLPTSGTARYASPLGVYDFIKRTSVVRYAPGRLERDAEAIIALAEAEGLFGHAEAVRVRVGGKRDSGADGQRDRGADGQVDSGAVGRPTRRDSKS